MSILTKYFKNTSWYIFGSSIQGLTPLLLTPVLTRTLSQTEFSQFVLYIAIATILSFLFSLGLPAALTRELILDSNNLKNNLISLVLVKRLLIGLSSLFILGSVFFNSLIQIIILAIALGMSLAVIQIDMAIYRAQQQASKFVFFAICSTALPTLLMTIFVATGYLGSLFLIFYTLLVLLLAIFSNTRVFYTSGDNQRLSLLFKLGAPTIPHGLGMSLMQYGDRIIIASALGLTAAGKIQIAALLGTAPLLLLSTLNHAWIPMVLEKFKITKDLGVKFLNTSTTLMALFISIISLIIMALSGYILNIFAPASFNLFELSPVVVVMTISSVVYVFYLRNTHVLTFLGKFQSLAWITPISILLQILFIYGLSSAFGLLSAAFAILVASSSQAVLTQLAVRRLAPELKLTTKPLIFIIFVSFVAILILV